MSAAKKIAEFVKKHRDTTVTFEFIADLDQYIVKVRNFNDNTAFSHAFSGIEFESAEDKVIEYALDKAEKELFNH